MLSPTARPRARLPVLWNAGCVCHRRQLLLGVSYFFGWVWSQIGSCCWGSVWCRRGERFANVSTACSRGHCRSFWRRRRKCQRSTARPRRTHKRIQILDGGQSNQRAVIIAICRQSHPRCVRHPVARVAAGVARLLVPPLRRLRGRLLQVRHDLS